MMAATISPPRQTTYSPSSVSNQSGINNIYKAPGGLVRHFNFNAIGCVTDDDPRK